MIKIKTATTYKGLPSTSLVKDQILSIKGHSFYYGLQAKNNRGESVAPSDKITLIVNYRNYYDLTCATKEEALDSEINTLKTNLGKLIENHNKASANYKKSIETKNKKALLKAKADVELETENINEKQKLCDNTLYYNDSVTFEISSVSALSKALKDLELFLVNSEYCKDLDTEIIS